MIKGRQFPVCARCTGVYAGGFAALLTFWLIILPLWLTAVFCALMFADWLIQYLKIKESTNIRRLVTGFLCGYALTGVYIQIMIKLLEL